MDVHRLLPRVLLRGVCSIFQFWLERIQAWIPPVTWTLRVLCAHPSSLVACVEDMGTVLSIAPQTAGAGKAVHTSSAGVFLYMHILRFT